uniref:Uncharacterized protein n=1 Tax=Oryza sativa subsp. japonica TaxID=39947 RepID=B0FFP1_ORYSJ|nr:hypothetical protein [Oryza sativa Japonica Group]
MQTAASSVVGLSAVLPAAVKGRSLQIQAPRRVALRVRAAAAAVAVEAAEVDYSSNISVFPRRRATIWAESSARPPDPIPIHGELESSIILPPLLHYLNSM